MLTTHRNILKWLACQVTGWYEVYGRHFSWRYDGYSHYRLVVTELLLQRTRAEAVSKFESEFFKTYPNWESLERSSEEKISRTLAPLGLQHRRAKALKNIAWVMVRQKGQIPEKRTNIDSLPGVGQYVANAIELLIFDRPRPLLDTNMARVLERFIHPRKLSDIRYDPWLQEAAQYLVEQGDPKKINWAVLDFAALICKPRMPVCIDCPIVDSCAFDSKTVK